jgi:hypothetical protein
MKENDDKSGMYIRQMQTGNFKGFREKDFESYYDDEYEYFLGKNKSTYNKSNVKLEYNYVSAFEYSIPMARETYDEVVPDAVGITVGTNAHAGFGGSTNVGFVFFTKGADFGFHGIHTKSAGAGFSAGVGFNIFAGYYNGDAKNMKSDFGGIGYQAGGKVLLGGTVWGAQKENGNLGWGGGSFGIGLSGGSSAEVTKTKYLGEK